MKVNWRRWEGQKVKPGSIARMPSVNVNSEQKVYIEKRTNITKTIEEHQLRVFEGPI